MKTRKSQKPLKNKLSLKPVSSMVAVKTRKISSVPQKLLLQVQHSPTELKVLRNNQVELELRFISNSVSKDSADLTRWFKESFRQDYFEFMKFYGYKEANICLWWNNFRRMMEPDYPDWFSCIKNLSPGLKVTWK